MSRKNRAQQVMNEYYSKLGPGPYYYDNSAVSAALREVVIEVILKYMQYAEWEIVHKIMEDINELADELEDDEL